MSVTTTANARVLTTANYLSDYTLHHTQPSPSSASPAPAPNTAHDSVFQSAEAAEATSESPVDWESQWRRIPPHRPVRDQRDEMRTTYTSEVWRYFVRVMFSGVFTLASASQIWRATGGKLNGDILKYKIGGEW